MSEPGPLVLPPQTLEERKKYLDHELANTFRQIKESEKYLKQLNERKTTLLQLQLQLQVEEGSEGEFEGWETTKVEELAGLTDTQILYLVNHSADPEKIHSRKQAVDFLNWRSCRICSSVFHRGAQCPTRPPVICHRCKEEGHVISRCPQNSPSGAPQNSPSGAPQNSPSGAPQNSPSGRTFTPPPRTSGPSSRSDRHALGEYFPRPVAPSSPVAMSASPVNPYAAPTEDRGVSGPIPTISSLLQTAVAASQTAPATPGVLRVNSIPGDVPVRGGHRGRGRGRGTH